jgi:hypothetical protein
MTDLWDYDSRWETTTRADTGAYDQVIALSQGIINENFNKLYEMYPELSKLYFKDSAIGTFEGVIQAPRILILGADEKSANLNEVIFQVRFNSGYLKDGDGKAAIPDLKNWIFSLRAPVVPENLPDPSTVKDPAARAKLEKKIQRIKERFDWPGDYSVERLYMKLSAANWNNPEWSRSVAGKDADGNDIPYLDWSLQEENSSTARRLTFWLGEWASKLDNDSMNSMGLSFKSPTSQTITPTFAPIEVLHQTHHYISAKNGCPNGQTGFEGAGNCNCLLYLEMVQGGGARPADPRLIWSGNFATQDGGPDHPPIRATYLLKRELFFETFILPELRALNRASDVWYDRLEFVNSNGRDGITMNWQIGSDPAHRSDDDGAYDFKPVPDPDDGERRRKYIAYRWNKTNTQNADGPLIQQLPVGPGWGKASTNVIMQSDVTWTPGGSEIRVSGTTTIHEVSIWSDDKNFDKEDTSYFKDNYVVRWSLKMNIVPRLEQLDGQGCQVSYLDVEVPGEVTASVDPPDRHQKNVEMHGHDERLLSDLKSRMADQFSRITGNIRKHLKASGRFTYPGNGKLIFENPGIGKFGELNAQVRYAPLEKEDWIVIPSKEDPDPQTPVKVELRPRTGQPVIQSQQLEWTPNSLKALQPLQNLRLRGVNKTSQAWRYAALTVTFKVGRRQECLFDDDVFALKTDASKKDDDTTKTGSSAKDAATTNSSAANDSTAGGATANGSAPKTASSEKENPKGTVELLKSDGLTDCQAKVDKVSSSRGVTTWQVVVSTVSGKSLVLKPNDWVELSITGTTSLAGKQPVNVDESFRDDDDKDLAHFEKAYEVLVS